MGRVLVLRDIPKFSAYRLPHMFRFFRQIRQRLLAERQLTRYLLYALGEIVLVVIGILLALQINEWNENRKVRLTEKGVLSNLKQEFISNRTELNTVLRGVEQARDANLLLMDLIGAPNEVISGANTDSILFRAVEYTRFMPTQNALTDLFQSGGLQLLSNEALKNLLYDWTRVMGNIDESYSGVKSKTEDEVLPYLTTRYPLKDMDRYGVLACKSGSMLPSDKTAIFQELTFENLTDDYLYQLERYISRLIRARGVIDEIIKTIEDDVPSK